MIIASFFFLLQKSFTFSTLACSSLRKCAAKSTINIVLIENQWKITLKRIERKRNNVLLFFEHDWIPQGRWFLGNLLWPIHQKSHSTTSHRSVTNDAHQYWTHTNLQRTCREDWIKLKSKNATTQQENWTFFKSASDLRKKTIDEAVCF